MDPFTEKSNEQNTLESQDSSQNYNDDNLVFDQDIQKLSDQQQITKQVKIKEQTNLTIVDQKNEIVLGQEFILRLEKHEKGAQGIIYKVYKINQQQEKDQSEYLCKILKNKTKLQRFYAERELRVLNFLKQFNNQYIANIENFYNVDGQKLEQTIKDWTGEQYFKDNLSDDIDSEDEAQETKKSQSTQNEKYIFIFSKYNKGDLHDFIFQGFFYLNAAQRIDLMIQATKSIQFLHQNNIVHRDIKFENFFVHQTQNSVELKLGDFGYAKFFEPENQQSSSKSDLLPEHSNQVGTCKINPPELQKGKKALPSSDVWLLGLVLYRLFQYNPNVQKHKEEEDSYLNILDKIKYSKQDQIKFNISDVFNIQGSQVNMKQIIRKFIFSILRWNHEERISIDQILKFLQDLKKQYENAQNQ